ncbi:integrase core domain-containing protein [Pedobacter sp. SYP-B3415]|uniref:integrase core domain-containing protein n=1 Tax=Pedobacter sp. SYP-B3415 TaxID=2496641 RepID=UPI003515890B
MNGILKQEYALEGTFRNIDLARKAVKQAIDAFNQRPHWSLQLKTPNQVHQIA